MLKRQYLKRSLMPQLAKGLVGVIKIFFPFGLDFHALWAVSFSFASRWEGFKDKKPFGILNNIFLESSREENSHFVLEPSFLLMLRFLSNYFFT